MRLRYHHIVIWVATAEAKFLPDAGLIAMSRSGPTANPVEEPPHLRDRADLVEGVVVSTEVLLARHEPVDRAVAIPAQLDGHPHLFTREVLANHLFERHVRGIK